MVNNNDNKIECIGITNRVIPAKVDTLPDETLYVVFLEYDDKSLQEVIDEVEILSEKYDLGWTYILDSKGDGKHFHVFSPVIVSPYEMLSILWDSSCERAYKSSFFTLKERTLRITKKDNNRPLEVPVIIYIERNKTGRFYSKAHLDFLVKYHYAEIPSFREYIRLIPSQVEFVKYKTQKDLHLDYDIGCMLPDDIEELEDEEYTNR